MKSILQFFLDFLAKLYIAKYRPIIVAVTGSVGKTSTKKAIATVLSSIKNIRTSGGNLNNEIGVPLTILGDWSEEYYNGGGLFFWLKVILVGFFGLFNRSYPEVLVLEYGADRPGDIQNLVNKYKPHIGVVTAIGKVPVHVEFFSDPEAVVQEKSKLVTSLKDTDFAVLNYDDLLVYEMKDLTKAEVIGFGKDSLSDLNYSNFRFDIDGGKPTGVLFNLNNEGKSQLVKMTGILGKSQAYSITAAAAVGKAFGMTLSQIKNSLINYSGPRGRMKIISGIKGSTIIDDTYNSSPSSTAMALDSLRLIDAKRRVAILGDMLELGDYTINAHREVGNQVGEIADILICIGSRAKFIADTAINQISKENIYSFDNSDEAKIKVQELIKEGDLILVKGSQGIRMEKIVEEIMLEPQRKNELLVRQNKKWINK